MEFSRINNVLELFKAYRNSRIKVITGLRRCGKSYLLFTLFKKYLLNNGFVRENILELDLLKKNQDIRTPDSLKDIINKLKTKDTKFVFIDEIQLVGGNFEIALIELMHKHEEIDFYITGSNSKTLSSEIVKRFGKYAFEVEVRPLPFLQVTESIPDYTYSDYLQYGGIPSILLFDNNERMNELNKLLKDTYIKDIENRIDDEKSLVTSTDIKNVLKDIAGNLTSEFSQINAADKITKKSNCGPKNKILVKSELTSALEHVSKSYLLIDCLNNGSDSYKPLKKYFVDLGLLSCINNLNMAGKYENAVFLELYSNGIVPIESYVKKSNGEDGTIDFSFIYKNKQIYIQVCYELNDDNWDREVNTLVVNKGNIKIVVFGNDKSTKPSYDVIKMQLRDFLSKGIMSILN